MQPKLRLEELPPVARTLIISMGYRAIESQRPDAMIRDEQAAQLLACFDFDIHSLAKKDVDQVFTMMRARHLDQAANKFLWQHQGGIVVDIGCGLDARYKRLTDTQARWFGLDFPEVIAARQSLFVDGPYATLISGSVLDLAWMDQVARENFPVIFLAEGVFPYLIETDIQRLVLGLCQQFPGSELVFDGMSHFFVWLHGHNPALKKAQVHLNWGIDDPHELEAWSPGIHLLDDWDYFQDCEPRVGISNLMRFIPLFARCNLVLHYKLG